MQRIIAFALIFLGLAGPSAHAQTPKFDGEPLADCSGIIGKWHNPWDVKINLSILDSSCAFTIVVYHPVLHFLSGPDRGSGKGYISHDGVLVVPLMHKGATIAHFLLKRQRHDIGGRALYKGNHPIVLNSVAAFPVDL